jgi:phosphoribosylformylglycinamidine synthase
MGIHIPKVELKPHPQADEVNLNINDDELLKIGKLGIVERIDENGNIIRRGSLALDLEYLKTIQNYFKTLGRIPTDVELESLAQTWSEHCKHTIFAAQVDDIEEGIFKHYIKRATEEIRKAKGENDICVSVFHDNAGGIIFDENFVVTDKVETHNTPSALDPFGGAITGILGVNRDTIGFGKGAKPILNRYGFCFGFPDDEQHLYRDQEKNIPLLLPKRIMEGVIEGVNVGGNCSGIPTPQGFLYFNERYKGKPLVFVGTVGLIPRNTSSQQSAVSSQSIETSNSRFMIHDSLIEKQAQVGDYIVMVGGKVGQDGIHGATFSSEALHEASPSTAVQIGDAITQKKLSDAIIKEARDFNLFNSITDNGAGGLSCSVAEMAKECGGCFVELEKVPTKYPNLPPWKIWISESQERMTLAVPKEKWNAFFNLMQRREVEATIIGEFTNSGNCVVSFHEKEVMNIDLNFLHDGLPKKKLASSNQRSAFSGELKAKNNSFSQLLNSSTTQNAHRTSHIAHLFQLLSHPNITSTEFVSQQYDHTVQGTSIISGLQGKGRVNGSASVIRPLLHSWKGVAVSQALFPHFTETNPYATAGITIDQAIRNLIAVGVSLEHIALLDNFCWCDSNNPERLFQLKETARGCYDFAVGFGTPFISGKDSMFNDFHGYNEQGNEVNISVLPTLLISSLGVVQDIRKCQTMDLKNAGDEIFLVGDNSLGIIEVIGISIARCKVIEEAIEKEILTSSYAVSFGGIGIGLAKMSIAGQLGIDVQLDEENLFAETPSRFLVTIAKENVEQFSKIALEKNIFAKKLGTVLASNKFLVKNSKSEIIIETTVEELDNHYKKTFAQF